MERIRNRLGVIYNIGLLDRVLRFIVGFALLAAGVIGMTMSPMVSGWEAVAILVSVYPILTAILGWDPAYAALGARSCSIEGGRNQCGTIPYEIDAALGHEPRPDRGFEYDHSLSSVHHQHSRTV